MFLLYVILTLKSTSYLGNTLLRCIILYMKSRKCKKKILQLSLLNFSSLILYPVPVSISSPQDGGETFF